MDTFFIPNENDFRRWIREALKEYLENNTLKSAEPTDDEPEKLLSRKEIAGKFRVSLVTLHDWMNKGLPFHKQGGRVYFLYSEVLEYVKQKSKNPFKNPGL
ncbi:helix-turn-helix domain-containing protein [Paraflavitalea speifideaquila]|uniref:helix-turn-helix domain-containing protein n=1 Tax=Paraflavitalea speifideaquila TaxID=3076558 RepID=UPI0028E7F62C|nr:helix-turn-helix domain-containing protein [Paraflavitalea speifideiaquila]